MNITEEYDITRLTEDNKVCVRVKSLDEFNKINKWLEQNGYEKFNSNLYSNYINIYEEDLCISIEPCCNRSTYEAMHGEYELYLEEGYSFINIQNLNI